MSYREKLYNASMNGGRGHKILVGIGEDADKEIAKLKEKLAAVELEDSATCHHGFLAGCPTCQMSINKELNQ